MARHPGWYPPGQVCHPPELPVCFKDIHGLKPIMGIPNDAEVMAIHNVIHAANKVSGISEMHDPNFFMKLADHLFDVQMARYRSKYSLVTFPSDATYVPPVLPAHISANLESVSGAPSDDEIIKVQDAIQIYQELRRVPSMFDAHLNMELSQHLFDLQMARHMRIAGESQPIHEPHAITICEDPTQGVKGAPNASTGVLDTTNNAGTGANVTGVHQVPQPTPSMDICKLMERSNQLAERFNQLLERSNELAERSSQITDQPNTHVLAELLDRINQLAEQSRQPPERHEQMAERFNQLFERFNQLLEQSTKPAQKANELAERSNQLAEQLNKSSQRSNELSEQANKTEERLGDILGNMNKVLVRIQHAIVRNHNANTTTALDCLVNDQGVTPSISHVTGNSMFAGFAKHPVDRVPVMIDGVSHSTYVTNTWLGEFLHFYGIGDGLCESSSSTRLKDGKQAAARRRLSDYLSSCLG